MGRTENINVFQDTMNLCKNNDRIGNLFITLQKVRN